MSEGDVPSGSDLVPRITREMLRAGPVFPGGYGVQWSFDLLSACQRTSPARAITPPQ